MQTVSESQAVDWNPQYDKEKIVWWLENVMLKTLFSSKKKIHIFVQPCNILYYL